MEMEQSAAAPVAETQVPETSGEPQPEKRPCKPRFSKRWLSGFTSNILGVVIGIALTFGISSLVQQRQERKQLREMIALLKREINDNKDWLEDRAKMWDRDFNAYWAVLWERDWGRLPKDSLDAYVAQIRTINTPYTSSYAWNVFQNSGMMQQLHNVETAALLSECYFWIESMRGTWMEYTQKKTVLPEVYEVRFHDRPLDYFRALLENPESRRMIGEVAYFNNYNFPASYEVLAPLCDYTIFMLENYDNPRKTQGMDLETFRKMREEQTRAGHNNVQQK